MLSFINISTVARFEVKTLLRSWFFRIFSLLSIVILTFFNVMLITDVGPNPPWMFRAIPASIPYFNLQLFNLVQAVIIVFLASDFLKRDKKLDTTDVIYIRSMSNGDYVLGKTIGVFSVFFLLNVVVSLLGLIFNLIQTDTPVVWIAYLYYPLIISLPTLLFITGLSFLLMVIFRNQAITFVVLLGYIGSTLFFLTNKYNFIFDYMAFKLPLMYSDFIGFGNLKEILVQRGIYLLSGLGFIFLTILLIKRLPQSKGVMGLSYVLSVVLIICSIYLTWSYIGKQQSYDFAKEEMVAINNELRERQILQIDSYHLDLKHQGQQIEVQATMHFANDQSAPIDQLILSLNPSLDIEHLYLNDAALTFTRNAHVILANIPTLINTGDTGKIVVNYRGTIDDQLAYLDIEEENLERSYNIAFMNVDKRYGFVEENFVLLTPELLWYPIAGVTYSPENPTFHNKQFSEYTIKVKTKSDLTALAQGEKTENTDGTVTFHESVPLPQVSLTIGEYEEKSIKVGSVDMSLYHLKGHAFYTPFVTELSDTLSTMISEIKKEYELELNLDYYYNRFSVIEVPVQFYSYDRRWASYQEVVQPQIVFVPERCATIRTADIKGTYNREKSRIERSNQAISEKELQARVISRFISGVFTSGFSGGRFGGFNPGDQEGFVRAFTQSSIYQVFPNYYSFIYYVKSGQWSVLNQAFESYITSENQDMRSVIRRRIGGLSGEEDANQALMKQSFENILKSEADKDLMSDVIKLKGNYLFSYIQSQVGIEEFQSFLSNILRAHKFKALDISDFNRELKSQFGFDLEPQLEDWLKTESVPGFLLSDIRAYEIRDGENTRYQVLFKIINEEKATGLITVSFRTAGGFGGFGNRGVPEMDLEKIIQINPQEQKEVGIVLDGEPRMMAINTLVSQNVPSVISHFFSKIDFNENLQPFVGERSETVINNGLANFEIIVDNEDNGFELIQPDNASPLKKWLNINNDEEEQKYIGIRFNNPPRVWRATAQPEFYGKYVLSAYVTRKGNGDLRAVWNADIKETGMHEVYYYVGRLPVPGRGRRVGGGQRGAGPGRPGGREDEQEEAGSYKLTVFHDDGEDVVNIDIASAEQGWNLLGSYYLSAGPARVVLSNETEGRMVVADAVKWVKLN
jgi:hypothetical protein